MDRVITPYRFDKKVVHHLSRETQSNSTSTHKLHGSPSKTSSSAIGGSYNVIVGSSTNRKKPIIQIEGNNIAVHLGSLLEAKSTFTRLAPSTSESSSFTEDAADLKTLIQPMLECMAISQVVTFPDPDAPVVNFMGNKFAFRPLLRWMRIKDNNVLTRVSLLDPDKCQIQCLPP